MEYLLIPRTVSLLTYPADLLKYASSCQIVLLTDDRASVHSLHGEDFYKLLQEKGLKPFVDLGIQVVNVAVSAVHFRLVRLALRGLAGVHDLGPCTVGRKPLRWIEIRHTTLQKAPPA